MTYVILPDCLQPFWDRCTASAAAAAAAAAKSFQSCPTLCDPIDGSPRGPAVPGVLYGLAGGFFTTEPPGKPQKPLGSCKEVPWYLFWLGLRHSSCYVLSKHCGRKKEWNGGGRVLREKGRKKKKKGEMEGRSKDRIGSFKLKMYQSQLECSSWDCDTKYLLLHTPMLPPS